MPAVPPHWREWYSSNVFVDGYLVYHTAHDCPEGSSIEERFLREGIGYRRTLCKHCERLVGNGPMVSPQVRSVALAARAFALALALVFALAAPLAGQRPFAEAGPTSNEPVKKRALWTNCQGVSLLTLVDSDTDVAEESVWNAVEAALRSARIYYDDPQNPEGRSLWTVRVVVIGVGPANYVETGFLERVSDDRDDYGPPERGIWAHTVMTYRIVTVTVNSNAANLLEVVREQMDTFLVDYLRAHADCAEGSP